MLEAVVKDQTLPLLAKRADFDSAQVEGFLCLILAQARCVCGSEPRKVRGSAMTLGGENKPRWSAGGPKTKTKKEDEEQRLRKMREPQNVTSLDEKTPKGQRE